MKEKALSFLVYGLKFALKSLFSVLMLFVLFAATNTSLLHAFNPAELDEGQGIRSTSLDVGFILVVFFSVLAIGSMATCAKNALWAAYRERLSPDNPLIRAADAWQNSAFVRWWKR